MLDQPVQNRTFIWLGLALIVAGFFGHWFAAGAIGGTHVAYRDHMFGFAMLAFVSLGIFALIGRFLWKGRADITVLIVGALQALFGLLVYINRFNIG